MASAEEDGGQARRAELGAHQTVPGPTHPPRRRRIHAPQEERLRTGFSERGQTASSSAPKTSPWLSLDTRSLAFQPATNSTVQDNPLDIVPFTQKYNLTFPILLDESGDVTRAYQVRSLPSSYFINRQGIITKVVIGGPMSEALLRTRIEEALK